MGIGCDFLELTTFAQVNFRLLWLISLGSRQQAHPPLSPTPRAWLWLRRDQTEIGLLEQWPILRVQDAAIRVHDKDAVSAVVARQVLIRGAEFPSVTTKEQANKVKTPAKPISCMIDAMFARYMIRDRDGNFSRSGGAAMASAVSRWNRSLFSTISACNWPDEIATPYSWSSSSKSGSVTSA